MTALLTAVLADVLKSVLPELMKFFWDKSHENTTVEDAGNDVARRDRLLAAVRLRRGAGGDGPGH